MAFGLLLRDSSHIASPAPSGKALHPATAPIDNRITEFVPSIASHIHTHVVFVQRIIDRVAVNPP